MENKTNPEKNVKKIAQKMIFKGLMLIICGVVFYGIGFYWGRLDYIKNTKFSDYGSSDSPSNTQSPMLPTK